MDMELKTLQCADVQNQIKHNQQCNGDSEMIPKQRRPGWQYWAVADLFRDGVLDIGDGYRAKNSEMGESGLPFARAGNLNNGFHFDDADILSEESVRLAGSKISKSGDITFTSKGTFGRFAMVRENTPRFVYSPQLCYWRVKQDGIVDRSFLYYWMQGDDCMNQLNEVKGLTDMADYVSLTNQRRMWLSAPPLPVQRRIAGILSAYDELIENSQRRIRILEEMARSLYREWFVHFRFPGHENHPLVPSSLGDIPQEWEVKPLKLLMVDHIGGGWGKDIADEDHTEPAWVIRGTDIPDARSSRIAGVPHRFHTLSNLRTRRLQAGDILFEVSGGSKGQPVGRTLLVTPELLSAFGDESVICASFCKRVRPDAFGYGSEILYLSFLEGYKSGEIEQFQVQSTGISNFKWTEYIAKIERVIPPEPLRFRFRELVVPLFSQIATLGLQVQKLRRTCDLLLPRLLTGQVELTSND